VCSSVSAAARAGCRVGVRVVAGTMHRVVEIATTSPSRSVGIWMFTPGYPVLPENRSGIADQSQVGQTVPSRRAVALPMALRGSGTNSTVDLADPRSQQVPTAADGRLADTEERPRHVLGHVLAHQGDHQRHRPEQAQHVGTPTRGQAIDLGMQTCRELGQLSIGQSRNSLVPQRFPRASSQNSSSAYEIRWSCCFFKRDMPHGVTPVRRVGGKMAGHVRATPVGSLNHLTRRATYTPGRLEAPRTDRVNPAHGQTFCPAGYPMPGVKACE